jgi:hypothetical protein
MTGREEGLGGLKVRDLESLAVVRCGKLRGAWFSEDIFLEARRNQVFVLKCSLFTFLALVSSGRQ